MWNVKERQQTDGSKVMAVAQMTLWVSWVYNEKKYLLNKKHKKYLYYIQCIVIKLQGCSKMLIHIKKNIKS